MNINKFFSHSITFRQKILIVAVAGLVLSSVLYTYSALKTEHAIIRNEVMKKAEVVTELASYIGELPLISQNSEYLKKAILSLTSIPEVSFVSFYDREGNLLLSEGDADLPPREHPREKMIVIEHNDFFDLCTPVFTVKADEDIAIFQETDNVREARENVGWVRIGFSKASMKKTERSIIRRGLIIAVIFTLISILLVYKLFEVATRPLTALSNAVKSIRKGQYPEIPITSEDEIGMLTAEFNRMTSAIKDREDLLVNQLHLSAFAADVGKALTESEDLQAMVTECIVTINRYLNPALARIWIYNPKEQSLELQASTGIYTILTSPHKLLRVGRCEAGKIAAHLKSHCTNYVSDLDPEDRKMAEQHGIVSYAGFPLIVKKHLVGVLEICARRPHEEETLSILKFVVNEVALGIQHKLHEIAIKSSLKEKEILLREVHHRVKNNMQIISSLLNLQSDKVKDKEHIAIFNESRNRIVAMALVHEKLYRSDDFSNIDFSDYISSLANGLFSFYNINAGKIKLTLLIDRIHLGLDAAIPCGLIINELVSNSLKHAFPENAEGEIKITFSKISIEENEKYQLTVNDNGVGVPEGMDFRKTDSLGLQLVTTLVEHQLQGSLEMRSVSGTEFKILFKEPEYKQRT